MFRKVLIANRGEIAVRIAKTLQEMGIRVVGVYSEADRKSPHLHYVEEAEFLPGSTLKETYLSIEQIVNAAKSHHVDAIHPGYGFLSENSLFAQACADAKIGFIGPAPKVLRRMGDKIEARKIASKIKIPVIPGWEIPGKVKLEQIKEKAKAIGYPLLIKARAGGGGKGVRLVRKESELSACIESAKAEVRLAFGDEELFLEKYIESARHIEIQIFGDHHGNIVHLFERECSIQRRYQKIIEESPSTALSNKLRNEMAKAAVQLAKAIGYTNAGTVEFLLDENDHFYFLEVNTRLQVEHGVTELITGKDLVQWQVLVAADQKLPSAQEELKQNGHAMECRIYAEDPENHFFPCIGTLATWIPPEGPNIRMDSGVFQGEKITIDFDPMLAKLIVFSESRSRTIQKMLWALNHFVILGIRNNVQFLQQIIGHPEFKKGNLHTNFLEKHGLLPFKQNKPEIEAFTAAALALWKKETPSEETPNEFSHEKLNPWNTLSGWRAF